MGDGGLVGGYGRVGGGQSRYERRIEVFQKIHKKIGGGGVGGVRIGGLRVDVNEEFKFLGKFTQKNRGGGRVRWGSGWWGVSRVDVNAMLGLGGDVGYGGCEPKIEGIVQCTKRYYTILRKLKKCGGEGEG